MHSLKLRIVQLQQLLEQQPSGSSPPAVLEVHSSCCQMLPTCRTKCWQFHELHLVLVAWLLQLLQMLLRKCSYCCHGRVARRMLAAAAAAAAMGCSSCSLVCCLQLH
jgi:hypothetical protein